MGKRKTRPSIFGRSGLAAIFVVVEIVDAHSAKRAAQQQRVASRCRLAEAGQRAKLATFIGLGKQFRVVFEVHGDGCAAFINTRGQMHGRTGVGLGVFVAENHRQFLFVVSRPGLKFSSDKR